MSVDVVDEQTQRMAENSSAPPTMDSHTLAMDLPPAMSFTSPRPTSAGVTVEHPTKRDQNQRVDDIDKINTSHHLMTMSREVPVGLRWRTRGEVNSSF
jgi:hypothetical protein